MRVAVTPSVACSLSAILVGASLRSVCLLGSAVVEAVEVVLEVFTLGYHAHPGVRPVVPPPLAHLSSPQVDVVGEGVAHPLRAL